MAPIRGRLKTEPPTVLVIDDDMDARRMYSEYLRINGCIAFTAVDGRSGIDKTNDLCPDVVVLDLAMPKVDGWTVLKHIRESSWTENIPVIVIEKDRERRFLTLAKELNVPVLLRDMTEDQALIDAYAGVGVDRLIISPISPEPDQRLHTVKRLAELAGVAAAA